MNKTLRTLSLTIFVFGLIAWAYIVLSTIFHPQTLDIQVTHFTPWLREDTFGIICFGLSAIGFFFWQYR